MRAILFAAILALASCQEREQPPTTGEQLQGGWERKSGAIKTRYVFNQGQADTYTVLGGQMVYENHYIYSTTGDTLKMLDIVEGTRTVFVVGFHDTGATLGQPGGLNLFLIRIK